MARTASGAVYEFQRGVEYVVESTEADAHVRLFNSDASEAEISGNGPRCVAACTSGALSFVDLPETVGTPEYVGGRIQSHGTLRRSWKT